MTITGNIPRQGGFALVGVLGILMVLAVLGTMVYRNVNTDITHTGRDVSRVRAEFAAESAVQWALAEASRKRPNSMPFTLATHDPGGKKPLAENSRNEDGNRLKLKQADVVASEGASLGVDNDGWIYQTTKTREASVSNAKKETLAFKIWYPDDSTLRIQGRGEADGSTANVDLVSRLREVAVPL
jgi:Tfp pilus assembly protein PilX